MNKRQAKKYRKKVVYPIIDEFNLLTLNQEELDKAIKDFDEYCIKHRHYKHYKDKKKIMNEPCLYSYPVGKSAIGFYEKMFSLTRKYTKSIRVTQSIDDLKQSYGINLNYYFGKCDRNSKER